MKYFITGIEGFVGHHLADHLLSRGHEVSGSYFDKASAADLNDRCQLFPVDLRFGDQTMGVIERSKPDCIFHLAAQSSPAVSFRKPVDTFEINVIGLVNLLEAVRTVIPDCRVLVVSSCEVYGLSANDDPIKEEQPYNAASPYAVSKISQEQLAIQYNHSYNMNTLVVRPFPHTGPGQPEIFALPSFAKQIAGIVKYGKEPTVLVGNLDAKRDISDVRDVINAYYLLAESGKVGDIYNICSGKYVTIREALDILIGISGKSIEIKTDPQRFRPLDIPILWGDNSKMVKRTSWRPEYNLQQTLEDLYNYWAERV